MNEPLFATPIEAETAFYAAYERADAEGMRAVWDTVEDIECVHPLGRRQRGKDVHRGWHEFFAKAQPLAFHLSDRRSFENDDLAVHLVVENILFADAKTEPLRILSTNVYRRKGKGWRMVSYHASPAPVAENRVGEARRDIH